MDKCERIIKNACVINFICDFDGIQDRELLTHLYETQLKYENYTIEEIQSILGIAYIMMGKIRALNSKPNVLQVMKMLKHFMP